MAVVDHPPISLARLRSCWIAEGRGTRRMYCFHSAGGAASLFRGWSKPGMAGVAIRAVQLPGREGRLAEPPARNMREAVDEIVDGIESGCVEPPDADDCFFGYSLGALVGLEVLRELRRRGRPLPGRLIVAASAAPRGDHIRRPPMTSLSDAEITHEIRRGRAVPEFILTNAEVMAAVLPTIRADFELLEAYQLADEPPLSIPIVAYGGLTDPYVQPFELAAWCDETSSNFRLRFFAGDHYFLKSEAAALFADLASELR
jgi:medium-chain acyl-[acyl-carrier-protein] hydrolase